MWPFGEEQEVQQPYYNPNEYKRPDTVGQAERLSFNEELPHHFATQKYCNPQDDLFLKEQDNHLTGSHSIHFLKVLVANPQKKEGRAFTAFSSHGFDYSLLL